MIAFSHPWALLLALPAAWLLWRSRRKTVQHHAVANLFLWIDAPVVSGERQRDNRVAPPWLVWLQSAVLTVLAVAIAAPSLTGSRPDAALVIDLSASMSARDGAQPRIELARGSAKAWLAGQPAHRLIRVIGAGAEPAALATIRAGAADAARAIDALTVSREPGDLVAAIELARRQTSGEIAVVTDLPAPAEAGELRVTWRQVGTPIGNLAITALRGTNDGGAILEVTNFGTLARNIAIDVTGEIAPWRERVDLAAFSARSFLFAPGPDRTLIAQLKTGDAGNAIADDDRRSADVRSTRMTVLAESESPALNAALRAIPDIALVDRSAQSRPEVLVKSGAAEPATIPSLIFVDGGTVPNIAKTESNGIRKIVVAVDLAKSSWPLTSAFPIFVADSMDWLSRRSTASLTVADVAAISESDTQHATSPRVFDLPPATIPAAPRTLWLTLALFGLVGLVIDIAARRTALQRRAVAATAIALTLIGIQLPVGSSSRFAAIALDSSASVSGNQRKIADRVRHETEAAGRDDRTSTVRFGGTETDIAAGLRTARASLPSSGDRRMVLVSDGQQTSGDAVAEARNAGAAGVPIDVVAIDSRAPAFIERVDAPASSHAGAPVPVRISVKGSPNESMRLAVTRDGRELDSRRVVLNDSGSAAIAVTDKPAGSGIAFYRVVLSDERLGLTLSESGAAVTIVGRGRVLVISDHKGAFAPLIHSAPLDVVEATPQSAPDTREGLSAFSAIVIDSIAPHRLTPRQQDAIVSAVTVDGAGLLFLGNKESLDASEFLPGAFSEALPIDFTALPNPPSTSASLALLVDISGSMASTSDGVTKISAARDAIARTLAIMPKADAVEVIGFAAQPQTLIGPNDPRDAHAVSEKLKSLSPSGSTALAPAVAEAAAWLKQSANQRRRILLVTDGKTSVTDAEATRAAVRGQSIEVSVVTIGADAEREWLTELAASTGGRAYFPDRLTDLAREVAREAARGTTGREINERFAVRPGPHPLSSGEPSPLLDGYIAGRLRDGAAAAWKSRSDDAVLAAWPRGLGRVAVFSSDLSGPWGAPLRTWAKNSPFWTRAIAWIARSAESTTIDAELLLSANGPRVVVDVGTDPGPQLPAVFATIAGPSGQTSTIALHAVTPTRFEGPAALGEAGDYRATITVVSATGGTETRSTRGWYWTGDRESQSRGLNSAVLEDIARGSGGRVLPALGSPVAPSDTVFGGARARQPVNAIPWLLLAALALLSFDYIRRATEVS